MKFLTCTNRGYLNLAENLAMNFQQPFMRQHFLTVECLDNDSLKEAKNWNFPNICPTQMIVDAPSSLSAFANFNTVAFNELVSHKFSLVLHNLTEDLWYLDADVAVFKDPVQFVSGFERYDWLMQLDESPSSKQPNWCSGCFRVMNTSGSRLFLTQLIEYYSTKSTLSNNDQTIFNEFLITSAFHSLCKQEKFAIAPLDKRLFQNGKNAFSLGWHKTKNPVTVHANYRIGQQAKIAALNACGKWFVSVPNPA